MYPLYCVFTPLCPLHRLLTPSYIRSIVCLLHRVSLHCISTPSYIYAIICPLHCVSSPLCVHSSVCPIHCVSTPLYVHSIVCLLYLVSTTSNIHSILCPLDRVFNRSFLHLIRACIVVRNTPYDAATFRNDKALISSSYFPIATSPVEKWMIYTT